MRISTGWIGSALVILIAACGQQSFTGANNLLDEGDGGDKECVSSDDCPLDTSCKPLCWSHVAQTGDVIEECHKLCVREMQACQSDRDCVSAEGKAPVCRDGYCQPFEEPQCQRDDQCIRDDGQVGRCAGGRCVFEQAGCFEDRACPQGFFCQRKDPVFPGVCLPLPDFQCRSNPDCPPGHVCQHVCWSYLDLQGVPHAGCRTECILDPNTQCSEGFECKTPDGMMGRCEKGICVPRNPDPCAQVDCGVGFRCEIQCPPCRPDDPTCGSRCYPVCVPDSGDPCRDVDCGLGARCEVRCEGACDSASNSCTEKCWPECVSAVCKGDQECIDPSGAPGRCVNGICVWDPIPCQDGSTCPPGSTCEWVCEAPSCNDPNTPCSEPQCHGVCVPFQPQCTSDRDCFDSTTGQIGRCLNGACVFDSIGCGESSPCPPGFRCETFCTEPACDAAGVCEPGACKSACVPDGTEEQYCDENVPCPPGFTCALTCEEPCSAGDPACTEPPRCSGFCVSDPPPPCNTDSDCVDANGRAGRCENGQCAFDSMQCQSDQDCPPGSVCEWVCGACDNGSPDCDPSCFGACVPEPQCRSDAECISENGVQGKCFEGLCYYPGK